MYIYTHTCLSVGLQPHASKPDSCCPERCCPSLRLSAASIIVRKGTHGVSTNGVTANYMFFDRGIFGVLPWTYLYLPKSARAYLFPPICRI